MLPRTIGGSIAMRGDPEIAASRVSAVDRSAEAAGRGALLLDCFARPAPCSGCSSCLRRISWRCLCILRIADEILPTQDHEQREYDGKNNVLMFFHSALAVLIFE